MNNDLISREYVEGIVEELENICQNAPEEVLNLLSKVKNAPTEKVDNYARGYQDGIKTVLAERSGWIPVTYRPMTEEEEKEHCAELGVEDGSLEDWEKRVFTCRLPDDGQEILISWGRYVKEDICAWDEYGCGLEDNGDWDGVDAWMPKPEPYDPEGGITE